MSNFNPLVSIIIPVYNGSAYMREAIDSALGQTYENIEVIVVNDGSKDNSEEVALSYGDSIRYFSKKNGGVSTALNLGIANMRGEYFSWLSHDDVYYPNKIEKSIDAIKDCPERIVYSDYDVIDNDGNVLDTANFRKYYRYADFECGLFVVLNACANGCTMLISRYNFTKYGTFDETLRTTQDYELFFKMFRDQQLVYINEPLTKYRSHDSQQTNINPLVLSEGNALWIGMLDCLSKDEILALGGSARMFWYEKYKMLSNTIFLEAAAFAEAKYTDSVEALKNAKVSVIMPFYNRLDLIAASIESVINQTYQNWELILANDGTSEDISIVKALAKNDDRIKIIDFPHRGVSATRNSAMDASSGEFIAFLDSDDLWMPEKLEIQLAYMLDNGFAFSHTSFEQRYLDGNLLSSYDVSGFSGDVFFRFISEWSICTCTVMFERTAIGDTYFPEHISMGEDICLWLRFLWRYEAGAISETLSTIRVQVGVSASQNVDKGRRALYSVVGYLMDNYYTEECLPYIGSLIYGLHTLFPALNVQPQTSSENLIPESAPAHDIPSSTILSETTQIENNPIPAKSSGVKGFFKFVIKKLFGPIYWRLHNRIVGAIINEVHVGTDHLLSAMSSTREQLLNEVAQSHAQLHAQLNAQIADKSNSLTKKMSSIEMRLSDEVQACKSQTCEKVQSSEILLAESINSGKAQLSYELNSHASQIQESFVHQEFEMKLLPEVVSVNTAAFAEYKNFHHNSEVVVLGAGPTLSKYAPFEHAFHIGVNRVCLHEKVQLDYLFLLDANNLIKRPDFAQVSKELESANFKKFFGLDAATYYGEYEPSESFCARVNATRFFVEDSTKKQLYPDIRVRPTMLFRSVIFPAIHFALFTNPKKLYLVGCDMSLEGYFTGEKQIWQYDLQVLRNELILNFIGYRRLKEFAQKWYPDTEIISINPVNLKGLFTDVFTDAYPDNNGKSSESLTDFSDESIEAFVDSYLTSILDKSGLVLDPGTEVM